MGRIVFFLTALTLIFVSCDEILIGEMEEGDPVQLRVEVYNSAADSELDKLQGNVQSIENPIIDQLKFHLSEISVGNSTLQTHSFMLKDSLFYLSENGESTYLAEKVIPAGSYQDLQLLFGGEVTDNPEKGNTVTALTGSLELSGVYDNSEFAVNSFVPLSLDLEIDPSLTVQKNTGSATVLTLYFEAANWFTGADQNEFLDPTDSTSNDQIVENILASAGMNKSTTEHDPTVANYRSDRQFQLGVRNADVLETDGSVTFTVELSKVSDEQIQVDYVTYDINATAGEDYVTTYGTLTFSPGTLEHTLEVDIMDDGMSEPDEKFFIRLLGPVNAAVKPSDKKAMGTIYDDESTGPNEMLICHYPDGNGDTEPQTMRIRDNAWPSHEAHGDVPGVCSQ